MNRALVEVLGKALHDAGERDVERASGIIENALELYHGREPHVFWLDVVPCLIGDCEDASDCAACARSVGGSVHET